MLPVVHYAVYYTQRAMPIFFSPQIPGGEGGVVQNIQCRFLCCPLSTMQCSTRSEHCPYCSDNFVWKCRAGRRCIKHPMPVSPLIYLSRFCGVSRYGEFKNTTIKVTKNHPGAQKKSYPHDLHNAAYFFPRPLLLGTDHPPCAQGAAKKQGRWPPWWVGGSEAKKGPGSVLCFWYFFNDFLELPSPRNARKRD